MTALMYHDIAARGSEDASGFPGRDAALYKLTPELFEAHVRAIVRATSVASAQRTNAAIPVVTFDDGGVSALRAADTLEQHGLHGYFFMTTNYIGTRGFMDARDLRDLRERGHVIGSHSCSHPLRIGHCTWPQLLDEWARSATTLEDILGEAVTVGSVPGGDFAPKVAEAAAKAGFTKLFTSEPTRQERDAFGLTLHGRFTIQRWTTPATAAALVLGEWMPTMRQQVAWNVKKVTKRLGGERYLWLRKLLLGHDNEMRWGDQR